MLASKSFALNSCEKIIEVLRSSGFGDVSLNSELTKVDYYEKETFKVGDIATVSGEPADGEFQISENEIGLFIEGELTEVSELKAQ